MEAVADMMDKVLRDPRNEKVHRTVLERVKGLCREFPFYAPVLSV